MRARKPSWSILYESKDVSDDIAEMVTSVTYTDELKARSDELELTVEDTRALWRTGWFPAKTDRLVVAIGYEGEPLLPCGKFEIDEIALDGPPDRLTIRALAAGVSKPARTSQSRAWEATTLRGVVDGIAGELGLEVVGEVAAAPIKRVTQSQETNLAFLGRLAREHGYAFSVRGEQLVFYLISDLEQAEPVTVVHRTALKRYALESGTRGTYIACEVTYLDPETGELITKRVEVENPRRRSGEVPVPDVMLWASGTHRDAQGRSYTSQHELVRDWKAFLTERSLYSGNSSTTFDAGIDKATRVFQTEQRLEKVDGIVGPETFGEAINLGFVPSEESAASTGSRPAGDVLRVELRCESAADAEARARALLHEANRLETSGTLTLAGDPALCAGVKFTLTGMLRMNGEYLVERSRHRMSRSGGYETEVEVAHV